MRYVSRPDAAYRRVRPVVESVESRLFLSTVSFSDNFTPAPSPLWSNSSGGWTAAKGAYLAKTPSNNPAAYTLLPFALTNFTLSVQVNNMADSGILLHSDGNASDSVLLVLGGAGYGQGQRGGSAGTSLYWQEGSVSNPSIVSPFVQNAFAVGSTHTITVVANGNTYSAYIDHAKTAASTFVTSAAPLSTGLVGLYDDQPNVAAGGSGTPTTFSNFTLNGTDTTSVSISGAVFNDQNGNGKIDAGEAGLPGVKVFLDLADTGKFAAGDPTATTSGGGKYAFSNLAPGIYHVAEVLPSGLIATSPLAGEQTITALTNASNVLFGDAAPVSVSGTVFLDGNEDGLLDDGEKGLPGFTVFIDYNNDGKFDASDVKVTTGANGQFSFTGLRPGTWSVEIESVSGYSATTLTKYSVTAYGGMAISGISFGQIKG